MSDALAQALAYLHVHGVLTAVVNGIPVVVFAAGVFSRNSLHTNTNSPSFLLYSGGALW